MPFIASTLTASQKYATWSYPQGEQGMPQIQRYVLIQGGANVPPKTLVTPLGAVTEVSDSDLELLENNHTFCTHRENGYVKVLKKNPGADVAAQDLTAKDASAPLTPDDFGGEDQLSIPDVKDMAPQGEVSSSMATDDEPAKPKKRRGRPPKNSS